MKWILIVLLAVTAFACNLTPRPHPIDDGPQLNAFNNDNKYTPTTGVVLGTGDTPAATTTEQTSDVDTADAQCDESENPDSCDPPDKEPCESDRQ